MKLILSVILNGIKDKLYKVEAISDILYLFNQESFILNRENLGNFFSGICGKHLHYIVTYIDRGGSRGRVQGCTPTPPPLN